MPKLKQLEKCKHPNSRKTKALTKQMKKKSSREKMKLSSNIKLNILGEKMVWFRDNLYPDVTICLPEEVQELIAKYLGRFNDELEQIRLKHSIGHRKNRQHASRESIINMTIKREKEEYNTCGLEIPNLLDLAQLELLKNWNGELRFLQNFKLKRFSKKDLEDKKRLSKTNPIENIENKIFESEINCNESMEAENQ